MFFIVTIAGIMSGRTVISVIILRTLVRLVFDLGATVTGAVFAVTVRRAVASVTLR